MTMLKVVQVLRRDAHALIVYRELSLHFLTRQIHLDSTVISQFTPTIRSGLPAAFRKTTPCL